MTSVRTACLAAAIGWAMLHVTLAILYADATTSVPVLVSAVALFLAAAAVSVWPVLDPQAADSTPTALALAASVPLVQLLSVSSLEPGAVKSYANWAAGGTGLVLASLVLRGHGRLALLAGAGIIAVQTIAYYQEPGPDGFDPVTALLLAVPPELWLLASWGMRRMLRATNSLTVELQSRTAVALAETTTRQEWARLREERLRELDANVLPFLSQVAAGELETPAARQLATDLASDLRDALRARVLLDGPVRHAVAAARARGVRVTLSSEPATGELALVLRSALPGILARPELRALSVRVVAEPAAFTCILSGVSTTTAEEFARAAGGAGVVASDGLVVVTSPPAPIRG